MVSRLPCTGSLYKLPCGSTPPARSQPEWLAPCSRCAPHPEAEAQGPEVEVAMDGQQPHARALGQPARRIASSLGLQRPRVEETSSALARSLWEEGARGRSWAVRCAAI